MNDKEVPVRGSSGKIVFQAKRQTVAQVLSYLHFIHQHGQLPEETE